MRGLLLVAFIAVSADAIKNNGVITQAVWTQASAQVMTQFHQVNERIQQSAAQAPKSFAQR